MENRKLVTLNKRSDFQRIRESGKRIQVNSWLLFNYLENDLDICRIGMTYSAKLGNSVVRNRLKRWTREFFRKSQAELKLGIDLNVILRPSGDDFYKKIKREDFISWLQRGWNKIKKS